MSVLWVWGSGFGRQRWQYVAEELATGRAAKGQGAQLLPPNPNPATPTPKP